MSIMRRLLQMTVSKVSVLTLMMPLMGANAASNGSSDWPVGFLFSKTQTTPSLPVLNFLN